MDILILPFEDDFETPLEIIEHNSVSSAEAKRIISKEVIPSRSYHISIFKDSNHECYVILDCHRSSIFRTKFDLGTEDVIETNSEEALSIALQFTQRNGVELLDHFVQKKKEEKKIEDDRKLKEWRARYKVQQKKNKKSFYKRLGIVLGTIAIIWTITSLIWTREIEFIGRNTHKKMAVIKEAEFYKESGKFVFQYIVYEFYYEGKKYEGRFKANRFTGRFYVGDSLLIKFRESDPNYSKRVD